ncbi:hypothetical protein PDJAM_G00138490 [Pangasius djambal]|uniref:Uncharacterized protein n=1 Tax=Pangasius djambal TaxID=1691987 RepID=A0ACC5ZE93_9TELE|nr:hypothetical protein [Pangasius djambal]
MSSRNSPSGFNCKTSQRIRPVHQNKKQRTSRGCCKDASCRSEPLQGIVYKHTAFCVPKLLLSWRTADNSAEPRL